MTPQWRLLRHGARSAAENMAIDEAILRHVGKGPSGPTLRFYRWDPSAVSIGYFQGIEQEVDLEACERAGMDVVRRLTGGGAVYHDYRGEITYSLVVPLGYPGIPARVVDSYRLLCDGLVRGLQRLGLSATFAPINDIVVKGRKISGNAQTRRYGGILQHGTLLCSVNPHVMFSLLKVPNEKMRDKLIAGVEERVTSIERELGRIDYDHIVEALIAGFREALGIELSAGDLTPEEIALAQTLRVERYENHEWNYKR